MNKKALVVTGAFAASLALGTAVNLVSPQRDFSETENRYLQKLPAFSFSELFAGRFTEQFDTYTTDQVFGRDYWVGLKTMTHIAALGKDNGRAYFGKDGYLFEKTAAYDPRLVRANCAAVADFVQAMREAVPALRAKVMLVPTAAAILPEKLPLLAPVPDQRAVIETMKEAVGADTLADPWDALVADKARQPFYRTDHHWTTAGAYTGYAVWAAAMGETPTAREAFRVETAADDFYGTVYSKANLYTVRPDRLEFYRTAEQDECTVSWTQGDTVGGLTSLYDASYLQKKDKYAAFLGGNHPLTRVTGSATNGRVLLLIKDSYANALTPFLTAHYEKIVLVDPRYYKDPLDTLLTEERVTDLLVLYNVGGFCEDKALATALPGYVTAKNRG